MAVFNIGDRVEAIGSIEGLPYLVGKKGTVRVIKPKGLYSRCPVGVEFDESFAQGHSLEGVILTANGRWCEEENLKKTGTKTSFMKKITTLFKKLVDADTAVLVKAGYLNNELELTREGEEELMTICFIANKTALVDAAKAKAAEEDASK